MEAHSLHLVLRAASLGQLEKVIDWIERPWEPGRNNALRARWHQARRDSRAHFDLATGIESEILTLPPRDLQHVARRMGFEGSAATTLDVIRLVAKRLENEYVDVRRAAPHSLLEPLATAAAATSELLASLLEGATSLNRAHRHSRRRRHGRR